MRTTVTVVALTTALAALGSVPAQADATRTVSGPNTGDPDVFLTYVGCSDLFAPATAPRSRINLGPYDAPLGRRSLGLVPPATGSAAGPFARFESLSSFDSSLSVASTSGSLGVAYVMSITASSPPGTAWSGRAVLTVPAGGWTHVSSASLVYDWTLVDLDTLTSVAPAGTATPGAFAAAHGDGAGFAVTGFGCDGGAFNLDAVSASGSTFDFEGVPLTTTASVDRQRVESGEVVSIGGRVTDGAGRVMGDPLVLESRRPGGEWSPVGPVVLSDSSGLANVDVPILETTEFRWHRLESQYADEGWSDVVVVTVEQPTPTTPQPTPTTPPPQPTPTTPPPQPTPTTPPPQPAPTTPPPQPAPTTPPPQPAEPTQSTEASLTSEAAETTEPGDT